MIKKNLFLISALENRNLCVSSRCEIKNLGNYCPCRVLAQTAKTPGDTVDVTA